MGKVVKTVLKVAAVAAVAYFAPAVAASVVGSAGLTGTVGALAGTAISAGVGAGMGKLIPGISTTEGLFAGGFAGAGKTGLFGGTSPTATAAGGAGVPATTAPIGGAVAPGTSFEAAFSPEYMSSLSSAAPAGVPQQGIGAALSGAAAKPTSVLTQGLGNVSKGIGGALGAVGLGGTAAGGGLNLGAIAPSLLGGALAGTPAGLKQLAAGQQAELQRAQQANAALTQQRLDQANQLISEAAYYDPEYMARQAAEAAAMRGGVQATEATRGLTGERLAAEQRRFKLGTAKNVGTAYQQGYGTGVGARTQTRQAGIQAIPTEYPMTNVTSAMASVNAARQAKAEEEQALGALFGQVLGQGKTTSLGA